MYNDYLKRKEKIIITATEILDEVGIQGLTTKEIAKRQGITEPAIYRQFKSKQEIILSIIDHFSMFDQKIMNTIIEQKMSVKQGILYFVECYASYYESYPQITTILFSFDVFHYNDKTNEKMISIINKRHHFMEELIYKGAYQHKMSGLSVEEFSDMILGIIQSNIFTWKMNNYKLDLKDNLLKKINWLLCQIAD